LLATASEFNNPFRRDLFGGRRAITQVQGFADIVESHRHRLDVFGAEYGASQRMERGQSLYAARINVSQSPTLNTSARLDDADRGWGATNWLTNIPDCTEPYRRSAVDNLGVIGPQVAGTYKQRKKLPQRSSNLGCGREARVLLPPRNKKQCDLCNGPLLDATVLAGGPGATKQFCTFACYELWKSSDTANSDGRRTPIGH
jgi:hypothetical protein